MVTGWRKVSVPAKLHQEIKIAAAQDGRKIGDVATEALVAWLEARRAAGASVPDPDCEREVPT